MLLEVRLAHSISSQKTRGLGSPMVCTRGSEVSSLTYVNVYVS